MEFYIWVWPEIEAINNNMADSAEQSDAELQIPESLIWIYNKPKAEMIHRAKRSEAKLSKFCPEIDRRLKPK